MFFVPLRRTFSCVLVLAFGLSPLLADDSMETLPELPLAKVLELAAERSLDVKSETESVAAEKEKAAQAGTWQNPTLALAGGRIANPAGQGPLFEATLYQTLPLFGKLGARESAAEAGHQLAEATLRRSRLQVQAQAQALSYALAAAHRLTAHIEDRRRRFELIRNFLQTRSNAVPTLRAERRIVEHKLTLLEEHLALKKSEERQAWVALNRFVQQPGPFLPVVDWWENPSIESLKGKPADEAKAPEVNRQKLVEDKTRAEVESARRNVFPDVNVGLGYRTEHTDTVTHFYTGYLTLSVPLFDRGQHSVEGLRHQLEAEKLRSAARLNEHRQRREGALLELERQTENVARYPLASLEKLTRDLVMADAEFRRGRLTNTIYLELEAQTHELQDRVFESQKALAEALANFSLIEGRLVAPGELRDAE